VSIWRWQYTISRFILQTLRSSSAFWWLPSAARTAIPPCGVRWSGLFCGQLGSLEFITRLSSRFDAFCWEFLLWPENCSLLVLLAYTAHQGLRDSELYKSTVDIEMLLWWFYYSSGSRGVLLRRSRERGRSRVSLWWWCWCRSTSSVNASETESTAVQACQRLSTQGQCQEQKGSSAAACNLN